MTMHSAAKAKKNKKLITDRMMHEAKDAELHAGKRAVARAAMKLVKSAPPDLPSLQEDSEP